MAGVTYSDRLKLLSHSTGADQKVVWISMSSFLRDMAAAAAAIDDDDDDDDDDGVTWYWAIIRFVFGMTSHVRYQCESCRLRDRSP